MARILKISQAYYPYLRRGGLAVKVPAVARLLAERGHCVTVLTARCGRYLREDHQVVDGVNVVYLATITQYHALTLNVGVVSFCRRHLRDFDVVHIYGLYDLLGPVVGFFCKLYRVPYIVEPMGMFQPIARSILEKRLYHHFLGTRLLAGASSLVATSTKELRELLEGGFPPVKVIMRRNGIDLDEFKDLPLRGQFRRRIGIDADVPLLLFVGRLSRIKGLDLLLRAFATLPARYKLAIVGPDDRDGTYRQLEELRHQFKLEGRVAVLGELFGKEKFQAMVDADFLVLPSRNESFGNAAAEAVACGTPVIVTDRCGIAPFLNGAALVVPYDPNELASAMRRLVEDHALRERLRVECARVAARLSWDEPIERLEQLYLSFTRNWQGPSVSASASGRMG